MPTLVSCPAPILRFTDNAGNPAVGGTVLTQVGGVNYPTYQDVNGNTALPNPIPLNSRGEVSTALGASAQCFLEPGVAYTFTLYDAAGNQLWQAPYVAGAQVSLYGGVDTGAANAYVLANVPNIPALQNGYVVYWIPANANTGASTINVNGLGAVAIVNPDGSALTGGEIAAGQPVEIMYYNGNWTLLLGALAAGSGSFVGQLNTVNVTVKYSISGRLVSLTFPVGVYGPTSAGSELPLLGLPAALTPTTAKSVAASSTYIAGSTNVLEPVYFVAGSGASYFAALNAAFGSGNVTFQNAVCVTYSLD